MGYFYTHNPWPGQQKYIPIKFIADTDKTLEAMIVKSQQGNSIDMKRSFNQTS